MEPSEKVRPSEKVGPSQKVGLSQIVIFQRPVTEGIQICSLFQVVEGSPIFFPVHSNWKFEFNGIIFLIYVNQLQKINGDGDL